MSKATISIETVVVDADPGCLASLCFVCINAGSGGPANTIIRVSHDAEATLTVRTKKGDSFTVKPGATHRVELGHGRGPVAADAAIGGWAFSFEDGRECSTSRSTRHVSEAEATKL